MHANGLRVSLRSNGFQISFDFKLKVAPFSQIFFPGFLQLDFQILTIFWSCFRLRFLSGRLEVNFFAKAVRKSAILKCVLVDTTRSVISKLREIEKSLAFLLCIPLMLKLCIHIVNFTTKEEPF